ncbi:low-temperature-induced 78 kDa protein [Capsella rubella]|uniref:low-temperature-induced 78 kDa protein n=1 Tax=Capsella rubella TaxID=81985 RepID=UPI000CD4E7A7|nr:low-temperature-induced 78 kDa protein [Capsella rubella]
MDQTEEPLKTQQQHPEEVEHHENGASKMFRKVKAKAKKFKNSLTNHGSHEHDQDVVEEDDDDDELETGVNSSTAVTGKPETLNHYPRETNVPAPEEIVPPGTKVFPVVSSDYSKPVEPVPIHDSSYGHEALFHHPRTTDTSDKEETRDVPTRNPLSELSDRDESREAHHESLNTPVSLLSETEDVPRTFAPTGEDDHLDGQRKVNFETPIKLEDDPAVPVGGSDYLSGVSNYQSKVTDPTKEGSGEAGVPEIAESLGLMKVTDESLDQKPGHGFERDLSTRSKEFKEFDQDFDSVLGKDSPSKFAGESEAELAKDSSTRSHDFDMKTESGLDESSPSRSHEFDLKTESGVNKTSLMGFGSGSGAELGREFDQKIDSGRNEYSPDSDTGLGAPLGGNFPVKSHELDVKEEFGTDKDTPTGFDGEPDFLAQGRPGYGESEERDFPVRSDDVKVETELGRDLSTETHDGFSQELSHPIERDEFEESRYGFEETRDEKTEETKPKTYTEQFASMLGYSGGSPVGDKTQVAGTVDDEKLTQVNEKDQERESAVASKLPLSGGESGVVETEQGEEKGLVSGRDYLAEKLTPGEEDKALSEVIAEKLKIEGGGEEKKETTTKEVDVTVEKIPTEKVSEEGEHDEAVGEEVKGGGMVGMIKGWFGGGATEEVKPKSPHSTEESPQSLGTTVGTKGFPDSSESELGETGVGGGVVPVQKGL